MTYCALIFLLAVQLGLIFLVLTKGMNLRVDSWLWLSGGIVALILWHQIEKRIVKQVEDYDKKKKEEKEKTDEED